MRLIVLLAAWPLLEIVVLLVVGGWIGFWLTLGIVIGTGVFGVSLLRGGGLRSVADLRGRIGGMQGEMIRAAQGAMVILAGVLLVLPGFVGDLAGLFLLIPPVQALVLKLLESRISRAAARMATGPGGATRREPAQGAVIDATYDVVEPPVKQGGPASGWTRH